MGDTPKALFGPAAAERLLGGVALVALVTVLALAIASRINPTGTDSSQESTQPTISSPVRAVVRVASSTSDCPPSVEQCQAVRVELLTGADAGQLFELATAGTNDEVFSFGEDFFQEGDRILVQPTNASGPPVYVFVAFPRSRTLLVLGATLVIAILLIAGLSGFRLLGVVGLISGTLGLFTLPALLEHRSPLFVAFVSAALLAFGLLYLAGGLSLPTVVASVASLGALGLTLMLGVIFVDLARLPTRVLGTPAAIDSATAIALPWGSIRTDGLFLAGLIIGGVGALVTITLGQAERIVGLQPVAGKASFWNAVREGWPQTSSAATTLIVAYVGASLPVLLFFGADDGAMSALNRDAVATELVRGAIGSLGLLAALPIATALAMWAVSANAIETRTIAETHTGRPPRRRIPTVAAAGPTLRQRLRAGIDDD